MAKSRNQEMVLIDAEILELGVEIDPFPRVSAVNEEEEKDMQIRLLKSMLKAYDPTMDEKSESFEELIKAEIDRVKKASKATEDSMKDLTKRLRNALEKQASSSQSMVDNKENKN